MAKAKGTLACDKTEIILIDIHGGRGRMSITQDQVADIVIEKTEIKKLFKKISTEKATVNIRKIHPSPYLLEYECGENWAAYKAGLKEFATYNHITFTDNT
ncbi:MAG: hypothetical protein J6P31_07340 [Oscillospiraceae bacterium]|nr:hypothetical protein [Oscillospiraceae bacterium]